jgi:hypothetical protein
LTAQTKGAIVHFRQSVSHPMPDHPCLQLEVPT